MVSWCLGKTIPFVTLERVAWRGREWSRKRSEGHRAEKWRARRARTFLLSLPPSLSYGSGSICFYSCWKFWF